MEHAVSTSPALAVQRSIANPSIFRVVDPVRLLRKKLGLTTNDITALSALVSFLPRDYTTNPGGITIVFPSNASLCARANGMEERTLRRCLTRLEAVGLVNRKNSANGKRFPLRYGGAIRDAFGIDLKPLMQNYDILSCEAAQLSAEQEQLRSLKAEAYALHASLIQDLSSESDALTSLQTIKNILRRATTTKDVVLDIIAQLRNLGAHLAPSYGEQASHTDDLTADEASGQPTHQPPDEIKDLSARNGQIVRHVESYNKESIREKTTKNSDFHSSPSLNRDPTKMAWEDLAQISSFFPDEPKNQTALSSVIYDIGKMLRTPIRVLEHAIQVIGPGKLLLMLDYMLTKAQEIRHPSAYLAAMIRA